MYLFGRYNELCNDSKWTLQYNWPHYQTTKQLRLIVIPQTALPAYKLISNNTFDKNIILSSILVILIIGHQWYLLILIYL